MKNKNWLLKLCIMAFAILWFSLSFSSAINFHLNVEWFTSLSENALAENMMYVHFADNWNDFGWFIYFSDILWVELWEESEEGLVKAGEGAGLECSKKMEWFYYNAERGERLWPLDISTAEKFGIDSDVTTSWWIYTVCMTAGYKDALKKCIDNAESEDEDNSQVYTECENEVKKDYPSEKLGYYGMLTHKYLWQDFDLLVGVEYDTDSASFVSIKSDSKLSPTFIRVDNKYPVWFVYDDNGWVGLAWCRFDEWYLESQSMKNLINEVNTKGWLSNIFFRNGSKVEYDGEWIRCDAISAEDDLVKILVEWIVWLDNSGSGTKFWLFGNSSDTKMQYFGTRAASNSKLINYVRRKAELLCRWKWVTSLDSSNKDRIICWAGTSLWTWLSSYVKDNWRTLIVKQGNVTISPMVTGDNKYFDIFILDWDLIVDEEGAKKFVFTTGWFISSSDIDTFSSHVNGSPGGYNGKDAAVWSFVRWNFVVNWHVRAPGDVTLKNKYFIHGKFVTIDSIDQLENMFSWRCYNWIGSDGNYCPKFQGNPYRGAALVVIDQNYPSPLFDS